jgi:PD-(D/E)XK endonuclease
MMSNPLVNGEIAEVAVMLALLKKGKVVLHPHGNGQRYDLVIDEEGHFSRVQVKAGWLTSDKSVLRFNACSNNKGYSRQLYHGQIEFIAVYCSELNTVYLVPIDDVEGSDCYLRLLPTKNNQEARIKWAKDYQI